MTERVLTDQEIVTLSLDLASVLGAPAFVDTVRAIEKAVLAKVPPKAKPIYELWLGDENPAVVRALEDAGYVVVPTAIAPTYYREVGMVGIDAVKYVTVHEARIRERRAWGCGADWGLVFSACGSHGVPRHREIDRLYPLPSCDKCGRVLP